ncbi:MAG: energy transducer TonB [Bacteroidales bacterium]|jgi:protein TonB|nr:energy transducer TonB [Bacteroidales bacterium]
MLEKKTERANLENKKSIYFQFGLVVAMALVFLGFEWKSYERVIEIEEVVQTEVIEEIEIIQTARNEPPPPPPPQVVTTLLNIVDNTVVIDNDWEIDAEADDDWEYDYVEIEEEEEVVEAEIFTIVEENPDFPGGEEARMKYLQENIKYPQMARESGIQGTVYATFVVEPDGRITNVGILRGIGGGCDEEAIRVIRNMPRWKPGKQRSKAVRVQFNMPIRFVLAG